MAKDAQFDGFEWPDFTMTPNAVYRELLRELSPGAFKVLAAIVHSVMYSHREEGFAPLSQTDLVERTGLHVNTVRKGLRECIDIGAVIIIEPHHARDALATLYSLNFKPGHSPFSDDQQ